MSMLYKEVDDFEAFAYHQKQFKKITKKDLLGKWNLFFFYPADFTFVCPTELEDLQEKYQEFKNAGCEIYAISTDTHFAHKTWHDISENISKIEYPMIGDPNHALAYDLIFLMKRKVLYKEEVLLLILKEKLLSTKSMQEMLVEMQMNF